MDSVHEIYFLVLAFFSELIGTLSGVSSSTLMVPIGQLLETVQVTLALTATLHVVGNSFRTIMYRKSFNWPLVIKFGIPSILFTGLGAAYSDYFSKEVYSIVLGLFLVTVSVYFLFFETNHFEKNKWLPYVGGGLSGLLTGLLGSGGALRSISLTAFNLNPLVFIATSTLIDFGGDIFRLVIYLKKGYLNEQHYFYIPFLILVSFFANILAKRWIEKIPQAQFKKIVLIFVFIMGMTSIFTNIISI